MIAALDRRLTRAARVGVAVAIAIACVVMVQKSFHFAASAPALTGEDSIANVAVSLAEHGRYGSFSNPTESPAQADQTHAFYSYGPFYFWVAAAFAWLLGPSLLLFRMLHPLGVVIVVAAAFATFRSVSLIGAAMFALLMCSLYLSTHAPVARPDIAASVCAAMMFVCARRAIDSGRSLSWCGVGFFAGAALISDLSAAAIVPAAALIWLRGVLAERRFGGGIRPRWVLATITALAGGTAAAVAVYLVAIDFRLRDVRALSGARIDLHAQSLGQALWTHFSEAWSPADPWMLGFVVVGFCGAALTSMGYWLNDGPPRQRALALVMPAVVVATMCQLGAAFFRGSDSSSSILAQVTTIWAVCAAVSVAVASAREQPRAQFPGAELLALLCVLVVMVRVEGGWLTSKSAWEGRSVGQVNGDDYVRQVLAPLPEGSPVWGSLFAGLDAGDRTDFVQFEKALGPAQRYPAAHRDAVIPNFLVIGGRELEDAVELTLAGQENALQKFSTLFPEARYHAIQLVNAPPYGTTIVYGRADSREPDEAPATVAVNDGSGRQWASRLSEPLPVIFTPVPGVTAEISGRAITIERTAITSRAATLDPGFYLVVVNVRAAEPGASSFILASPSRRFVWTQGTRDLPAVPCLPGNPSVAILVDHAGGPLYLSRFAGNVSSDASMEIRSLQRVLTLVHQNADVDRRPLEVKFPTGWKVLPDHLEVRSDPDGGFHVAAALAGDSGTLESPLVPVSPGRRMILSIPVDTMGSVVTAGVSTSSGDWVVAPVQLPRRIVFDTGSSERLRIVLSSTGQWRQIGTVAMWQYVSDRLYVDRLMGCRSPYIHMADLGCRAAHAPGTFLDDLFR